MSQLKQIAAENQSLLFEEGPWRCHGPFLNWKVVESPWGLYAVEFTLCLSVPPSPIAATGPVFYALVAEANFNASGSRSFPDDCWIEPPRLICDSVPLEAKLRLWVRGGNSYATKVCSEIARGLAFSESLCRKDYCISRFSITSIRDAVAEHAWDLTEPLTAVNAASIDLGAQRVLEAGEATIQFEYPMRMLRPPEQQLPGHRFFDKEFFDIVRFTNSIVRRSGGLPPPNHYPSVISSNLEWKELGYGNASSRKVFGGVVGHVRLRGGDVAFWRALVLGQITGAGELTRMGFGRYSILATPKRTVGDVSLIEFLQRSVV